MSLGDRTFRRHGLAAILLLLACGCTSFDTIDSWPILSTQREQEDRPGRLQMIGPIINVEWQRSTYQWDFRPLTSVRRYYNVPADQQPQWDSPYFAPRAILSSLSRRMPPTTPPGEGHSGLQILALWPFYLHESSGPVGRARFLPIYYNYRGAGDGDAGQDAGLRDRWHVWGLFPLYFGGRSDQRGWYHAVFPIGGTLKNLFGRDRIDFVLFPIYARTQSGGRVSHNVLWPFFRYAYGDERGVWYFWPLIGRMHRQDNPPRWFFLWPFFWYTEEPEKKDGFTWGSAFFPFFGWVEHGDTRIVNIIWPLYSHTSNPKTGLTDYAAPWPIFRYGKGPEYRRFQLWPFYGRIRQKQVSRQYYLWPLFRFEQRETDESTMHGRSIFIIYRSIAREVAPENKPRQTEYENILWPFWYYKRDLEGNTYFCTLELRGVPDPQGYDRVYAFLWRIFEHEKQVEPRDLLHGTRRSTQFLWEAFRYDRDERSSFLRVFPAVTCRREDGRFTSFEVLMGMFGFIDKPGTRTFRVLFVPWSVERRER